jgi:hypothetical protein
MYEYNDFDLWILTGCHAHSFWVHWFLWSVLLQASEFLSLSERMWCYSCCAVVPFDGSILAVYLSF